MIEQLLFNLLDNAQKYTPEGSAIEIKATVEYNAAVIVVRDHGLGFADGEQTRIFEKFHRGGDQATQTGFGLGLAICKAIVSAHGGSIDARNRVDGGAEFRITLPIVAGAQT